MTKLCVLTAWLKQTSRRYRTLQARCAVFESSCTRKTECVNLAVFNRPSMAWRSFFMLGLSSLVQSTIDSKSRPSVNLFLWPLELLLITRVIESTAWHTSFMEDELQ